MARLIYQYEADLWEELQPGVNRVGSGDGVEVRIADDSIHPIHCEITIGEGYAHIRDIGGGIAIEGMTVGDSYLIDGQTITIGGLEFQFQGDLAAAPLEAVEVEEIDDADQVEPVPPAEAPAISQTPFPQIVTGATPVPQSSRQEPKPAKPSLKLAEREKPPREREESGPLGPVRVPEYLKKKKNTKVDFFLEFPKAFTYPLGTDGLLMLLLGSIMFAMVDFAFRVTWLAGGAAILAMGYQFSFMQKIIQSTFNGDDHLPDWPDITEIWDDLIVPAFQFFCINTVVYLPAILYGIRVLFAQISHDIFADENVMIREIIIISVLVLMGASVQPMAILSVSLFDSVFAMNPMVLVPSIFRVILPYLVCLIVMTIAWGFWFGMELFFDTFVKIPILPSLISSYVSLYLLVVGMRMLGLLYVTNSKKLGWFE